MNKIEKLKRMKELIEESLDLYISSETNIGCSRYSEGNYWEDLWDNLYLIIGLIEDEIEKQEKN